MPGITRISAPGLAIRIAALIVRTEPRGETTIVGGFGATPVPIARRRAAIMRRQPSIDSIRVEMGVTRPNAWRRTGPCSRARTNSAAQPSAKLASASQAPSAGQDDAVKLRRCLVRMMVGWYVILV